MKDMKDIYEAYEVLSAAYRQHLDIVGPVVFIEVIARRLRDLEAGAEKKDASHLKAALEEIRVKQPKFTKGGLFTMCEELVKAESQGAS